MIREAIDAIVNQGRDLSQEEAAAVTGSHPALKGKSQWLSGMKTGKAWLMLPATKMRRS